jgi:pterin-4a-carbinolamine dehydratase
MSTQALDLPEGWSLVAQPPALFRRYEFAAYAETRRFLDRLAEISRDTGLYPDLGFGRTHVNVTIHSTGGGAPGVVEYDFARAADAPPPQG